MGAFPHTTYKVGIVRGLTLYDLLLPYSVLVVDQTMSLNAVAKPDELFAHFFQAFLGDQGLRSLQLSARLHQILLHLE